MQLFTIVLEQPIPFGISFLLAATIVLIVLKAAMSTEERSTSLGPHPHQLERRILMTLLFIGWAVVFGLGLQLVPHEGANSPYGGIGLIALFSGFFIMMGFLWAVIGE